MRAVKYVSFIGLWRSYCSNIKIQAARSDLCDKCDQWLVSLRHSLSDEQRKMINDRYNGHNIKAKAFRDSYNANIEEAESGWTGMRDTDREQILHRLESRTQISPFISHAYLDMQMQYSFDYANRCLYPTVHSSEEPFISKHLAKSRCFACVVSNIVPPSVLPH